MIFYNPIDHQVVEEQCSTVIEDSCQTVDEQVPIDEDHNDDVDYDVKLRGSDRNIHFSHTT